MSREPIALPDITADGLTAISFGNAAIQVLGEFGAAEKIGRYWVARLEVDGFVMASVIGPPKENVMPETVNVKVTVGDEVVLDLEWGEDHCEVVTFAAGDWRDRLRDLGSAIQRRAVHPS